MSPVVGVRAISQSQLTEMIRVGLTGEVVRFFINSRESVSNADLRTVSLLFAENGLTNFGS